MHILHSPFSSIGCVLASIFFSLVLASWKSVFWLFVIRPLYIFQELFACLRVYGCSSAANTPTISSRKVFGQILRYFYRVFIRGISVPSYNVMRSTVFLCASNDALYSLLSLVYIVFFNFFFRSTGLSECLLHVSICAGANSLSSTLLTYGSLISRDSCALMFSFASGAGCVAL